MWSPTGQATSPTARRRVAALIQAGADVNAQFAGPHTETPLHGAASSDDAAVLEAQWSAARRLLERGATTLLW